MDFKVYACAWSTLSERTLTGIVDTTLSGKVITRSENHKSYTFEANAL